MSTVAVRIPTQLRRFSDGRSVVHVEIGATVEEQTGAPTVAAVLDALAGACPGVVDRVLDEQGNVRRHVNLFVGGDDVRGLGGLGATIPGDAEVTILPAVSGGAT